MLQSAACGFGSIALAGLCAEQVAAVRDTPRERMPYFVPRAKRVIFLFMQGGPSQVDTFDYKAELVRRDGQSIDFTGVRFGTFGKKTEQRLMKPLWKFARYGQCGQYVSELFPQLASHVDDLCFLQGVHTEGVAHGPSTLMLHTGATNLVRPSMGSWVTYAMGSENESLPGFVTLQPSANMGGPRNYANAFLPAWYQGVAVGQAGMSSESVRIRHLENPRMSVVEQQRQLAALRVINQLQRARAAHDDRLEATIESFELAQRMQRVAPEVFDLSRESEHTRRQYGLDNRITADFGRQCLLARRMAEAGVRYVQVNYSDNSFNPRWDQHSNMPRHFDHARATDRPVAGLISDLKQRGLLEDTLVWWGGEFGRTPFAQGNDGRDHNPRGFTVFLAGGGVKAGTCHGSTDEIGHRAVEGGVHMHDLHATILYLLGLDHQRLTYRYAGRDFRLTDVYGRIVHEIIA